MAYLAQPLALQLQPACGGTYLRWLSPLGTWEGWLFAGDTDPKTDVTEASSLSTADARTQVAVRRAGRDTLTLRTANLTPAQHQALSTILDSPQVYQQLPSGQLLPLLVSPSAQAQRLSSDGRHALEIEVQPPARNALTH